MARFAQACDFWRAVTATGLSEPRGERDEFVTLLPDGADACVKAQGVEQGDGGTTFVAAGAHWTVMRDPAGGTYCLTGRDPETGSLPVASPA
ncbi:hypothetical protein [Streptomyces acidicola]|uniref:hypothetical protein n=1 Tax=Streptomyces acidicola TaxID=2596892 RepID=UPI003F4E2C3B